MEITEPNQSDATGGSKSIPSYVLDDLSSRFGINNKPEELKSIIRAFFQVETAYWFYLDFHRVENPKLKECTMKEFSYNLIHHCPQLKEIAVDFDKHFEAWKQYKRTIGTYGAIILDKERKHVLLVQSYSGKNSWGFPKGKINQNEAPMECAAREVFEETGFDISPYLDPFEYLERSTNDQVNRLYVIEGVPLDTGFLPRTRREIKDIQWFPIETLPTHKGDSTLKETVGHGYNLFTVVPFLRELRRWVNIKQGVDNSSRQRNRQKQQKTFAQQNQSQYQEFMQLKKGKGTLKNFANSRTNCVRYSRDIIDFQDKQVKQGRRGMTVFQTLFGNRDPNPVSEFKVPEVDTKSFYSKAWQNFTLDADAICELLPRQETFYYPH